VLARSRGSIRSDMGRAPVFGRGLIKARSGVPAPGRAASYLMWQTIRRGSDGADPLRRNEQLHAGAPSRLGKSTIKRGERSS
jgi:hypothetical protein